MATKRWTARSAWPALGAAAPFALAVWLRLGPGPRWAGIAGLLLLGLALQRAGLEETPRFGRPPGIARALLGGAGRAFGWAIVGAASALLLAGVWAAAGWAAPAVSTDRSAAVYELDARIATQPLPPCRPRAASSRVLLERGAHPRLSPENDLVWFDAATPDGRRQVHQLERASGAVRCWTCDEPGNNERPSAGEGRRAVAFETDRFVSWREPINREIQLIGGGGAAPGAPSIRLTIDPASDRAPVLGPEGALLVWTRSEAGRQQLVGAGIRGGHGGILLGDPTPIAAGGLDAVIPLAWSRDARSLVFFRGNPLGTGTALRLDPATGAQTPIGVDAVFAPAGASADGGWLAIATSAPAGLRARLPGWLGFAIAPVSTALGITASGLVGTGIRVGAPDSEYLPVDLGELAAWGAPTGVALDGSGRSLVLGQRRVTPAGVDERLVEIALDCDAP
jgi:hypothetical protein